MTEPRIQYTQTEDGVSIAYWTMGEGTPFVQMPSIPFGHCRLELEMPGYRAWYERLSSNVRVVKYDGRGSGLSQREVDDFSLGARISELEAVVDSQRLDRFALFAPIGSGPVGIAYAAKHPDRVSHLIVWNSMAQPAGWFESSGLSGVLEMGAKDWDLAMETLAHMMQGWGEEDEARRIADWFRASVDPEIGRRAFAAQMAFDAGDLLKDLSTPTLILVRPEVRGMGADTASRMQSQIKDAQLVLLDGTAVSWAVGNSSSVLAEIEKFLSIGQTASPPVTPPTRGQVSGDVHAILFTDVEGSTALTDRLGDAKARDLLREHERMTREALQAHGGSEVKTLGDGFMASFSSATKALECAIALQQAFEEHNATAEEAIRVRVGVNAGEPIAENDPEGRGDLFGTAVNIAARIAAKAEAGEILASNVVRELVAGKEFRFDDRGETELRGFEEAVRVFEVRWKESD